MSTIHGYAFPTTIQFGPGALNLLPEYLKGRGIRRPLVVTDKGLAELPVIGRLTDLLRGAGMEPTVFAGIWGNPAKAMVTAGVDAFRAATADAIVGVGGGAAMDVGKVIALMVHHPGDLFDYEDGKPDARPVDQPLPAIVTVPTTAGTGSEVGRAAVISTDDTHRKVIMFDSRLLAECVFIDPELTLELPAHMTAATGMDALSHLAEAYIAQGHHPMCDGIALEGIRLVARSLANAVRFAQTGNDRSPEHLAARGDMMNAAMMGAVAFQKGLGVTHSCAHALSTVKDLHHGLANGVMLPYAMQFNQGCVADRFRIMAQVVGCDEPTPDAFVRWCRDLQAAVEIPQTLGPVGVTAEHLDALVDVAVADACHELNPRPVTAQDFRTIFTDALG